MTPMKRKDLIPFLKSTDFIKDIRQYISAVGTMIGENVSLNISKGLSGSNITVTFRAIEPDYWSPFVLTVEFKDEGGFEYAFCNNRYQVFTRLLENKADPSMDLIWLSIKTHGKDPDPPWRDLQRIKNDLCGTASTGMEIYPSSDRLVDTSNQYHLWVMRPGQQLPFGYTDRDVVGNQAELDHQMEENCAGVKMLLKQGLRKGNARQEAFKDYHKDDDLPQVGLAWLKYQKAHPDRWTGDTEENEEK